MAQASKIEWCHDTANLWWGCTEVHAGCDNCYARVFAKRNGKGWGEEAPRFKTKAVWREVFKWDAIAGETRQPRRVFTGSMMDIFEKSKPLADWKGNPIKGTTGALRETWFREVIPNTPHLLHLLLTKRPSNILKMVPASWLLEWPENVMTGTSPVDQTTADTLIPQLLRVPGKHFLSCEPLLGAIDNLFLGNRADWEAPTIDWVIVGGESGHHARPMHPDWARSLRDQCYEAAVPFFFKQWGAWAPKSNGHIAKRSGWGVLNRSGTFWPMTTPWNGHENDPIDPEVTMIRTGKKEAGRHLDGRTHNQYPVAR